MAIISASPTASASTATTSASSFMGVLDPAAAYLIGMTVLTDAIVDRLVAIVD